MQIVIDIPDNMKVMCEWHTEGICDLAIPEINILANAIANGTVLPKRHGRLVDSDLLNKRLNFIKHNRSDGYQSMRTSIGIGIAINENLDAPTIIKAESEE